MFSKLLFAIAAAAVAVNAQSVTMTGSAASASASSIFNGISSCVIQCVEDAATANGCSFTDAACVCGSLPFQSDATACVDANCSPADVKAGLALQQSQCISTGPIPSGDVTTTHSFTITSAAASATSAAASGSTTKAASSGAASGAASSAAGSASATAPATSTTAKASSAGVVANNGVIALFGAVLAGVLAL